jgi:hypothetical protein
MGGYTRTGRAQRRAKLDEEGRVTGYYSVNVSPGDKIFTMKVNEEFYEQLKQLVDEWDGTWSYAAVVRQLVAEATGKVVVEELKVPTQVALKARMPAKTVEQEVKMTKKQEREERQALAKDRMKDLLLQRPDLGERLAKQPRGRVEMTEDGTIQPDKLEMALDQWEEIDKR